MNPSDGNPDSSEPDSRPLIFLVDDEVMLLELNAVILEPQGYRVLTFRDPIAAVRAYLLANPRPILVITDFAMPGMNGMEVTTACRRANPRQKIIMISGTMDETVFRQAAEKPNRFLAKPYQCKQLTDMVRDLLAE